MGEKFKKNKGNKYKQLGDNFAEQVVKKRDESHAAQNSPARPHNY